MQARQNPPDLVLLDLMLPGLDGFEVFRRLRADRPTLPVIMVTARGEEDDRILGSGDGRRRLRDQAVQRARARTPRGVRASTGPQERRRDRPADPRDGDLTIDLRAHSVTQAGVPVPMTGREFDLLVHFVQNPGVAFSREQLMREVWGWEFGDQSTVTVHVRRLRTKVEQDPSDPKRLTTVWGVGYRWESSEAPA